MDDEKKSPYFARKKNMMNYLHLSFTIEWENVSECGFIVTHHKNVYSQMLLMHIVQPHSGSLCYTHNTNHNSHLPSLQGRKKMCNRHCTTCALPWIMVCVYYSVINYEFQYLLNINSRLDHGQTIPTEMGRFFLCHCKEFHLITAIFRIFNNRRVLQRSINAFVHHFRSLILI